MVPPSLPYLLSVPGTSRADSRWPLLCFLHGYDEGAPEPVQRGLTRHGPLAATSPAVATDPFIVVAPRLHVRGDFWHRHADDVADLLEQVQATHPVDPERIYLTGFSYGANGVFDLALEQPGIWAALWPVDPTRVPDRDMQAPVWLSSGEVSRPRASAFRRRLDLEPPGEADPGDRVYLDRDQDHVGTARAAYGDPQIYQWLLARRRGQEGG